MVQHRNLRNDRGPGFYHPRSDGEEEWSEQEDIIDDSDHEIEDQFEDADSEDEGQEVYPETPEDFAREERGASINYVVKNLDSFDPPPPLWPFFI